MNKLFVFALAAFVCSAVATPVEINDEPSEFAVFENDATETGSLSEQRKMFSDFCLLARDDLKEHIKANVNKGASFLFKAVGEQALEGAAKVGAQQREAVEKGKELIGQDARNTVEATGGVFSAIVDGVKSGAYEKYEQLKGYFTKDNLREQVFNGCADLLGTVRPKLESRLAATKSELGEAADESLKSVIDSTTLENVGCITTGRVSKIAKSCERLEAISPEVLKSIGL